MDLRRDELKRTARAPAKLNLFLDLLGRRADGFHELETVMVPVRLFDTLVLRSLAAAERGSPGQIRLEVSPWAPPGSSQVSPTQPIPSGPDNLVVRALCLLQERSGCPLGARVHLVKRIPVAAGLGGGSSDAATALRLANRAWGINWSLEKLAEVAAEVGSDVPFFLSPGVAICRGRGQRVERLPAIRPVHFVVVKPPVGLSTREVYLAYARETQESRLATARASGIAQFVASVHSGMRLRFARQMRNALQAAASSLSPWVDKLKEVFSELDFVGHQLSGSGSAYFGVCRHAAHARRLASILRTRQLGLVYATRSCQ